MKLRICCVVLLGAGLLSACQTTRGTSEFEAYRTAFDKNYAASNALLDQLAIMERKRFLRSHVTARTYFDPNLASYYVDTVDPAETAILRRSLLLVKTYNDLLYGLESGETAQQLGAKVQLLATSAAAAETAVFGAGALSLAKATAAPQLAVIEDFAKLALRYQSREDFRRFALRYNGDVKGVLIAMRGDSSAIFAVLEVPSGGASPGYRKLMADWVLGLDATIAALDAVTAAVAGQGASLDGSLTGLTASAIELETIAAASRKHLAEIKTN